MAARWFRIAHAENAFRRYATETGTALDAPLTATAAVRLAGGFYQEMRAQHGRPELGGDTLVAEWAVRSGDLTTRSLSLVRRLKRDDGTQPGVMLALTMVWPNIGPLRALRSGLAECLAPDELDAFMAKVLKSPSLRALDAAGPVPAEVRVTTRPV